jgi:predicted dehydrogenase
MSIRIGVIGCSKFAQRAMIPAIQNCQETELIAVASRTRGKSADFAEQFGCDGVEGYDQLLQRDDIDVVYIPLPTGLHGEWIGKSLVAGKHVLAEKSFASSFEETSRLVETARTKQQLVYENFHFLHHSQFSWIRKQIEEGVIGDVKLVRSSFGFPPFAADNIRNRKELGGGALLDVGGYVLKISQLFLGHELNIQGAVLRMNAEYGIDFYGDVMLSNASGQVAQLSFGFNYFYQCNLEILGTLGKLTTNRIFTAPPGYAPQIAIEKQGEYHEYTLSQDTAYTNLWSYFAEKISDSSSYQDMYDEVNSQSRLMQSVRDVAIIL